MTPFLSRRLLINLAVVAAAVGANAFVAYTQICSQRDADARTLREAWPVAHVLRACPEVHAPSEVDPAWP